MRTATHNLEDPLPRRAQAGDAADAALLAAVRAHPQEALTEMFLRYRHSGLRVATALVGADSAEDVVSDAFERVIRAVQGGNGPTTALRPYFLRTVHNCAIDALRRRRAIPASWLLDTQTSPDHSDSVDDALLLAQALAVLPARWQYVLDLAYRQRLDRHVIATLLDLSPHAVSQLTMRARQGLEQSLEARGVTATNRCA